MGEGILDRVNDGAKRSALSALKATGKVTRISRDGASALGKATSHLASYTRAFVASSASALLTPFKGPPTGEKVVVKTGGARFKGFRQSAHARPERPSQVSRHVRKEDAEASHPDGAPAVVPSAAVETDAGTPLDHLAALEAQKAQLSQRAELLEARGNMADDIEAQTNKLMSEMEALDQDKKGLLSTVLQLEARVEGLISEKSSMVEQFSDTQAALAEMRDNVTELESEVQDLEAGKKTIEKELEDIGRLAEGAGLHDRDIGHGAREESAANGDGIEAGSQEGRGLRPPAAEADSFDTAGEQAMFDRAVKDLSESDSDARMMAVKALGRVHSTAASKVLADCAFDPEVRIRIEALGSLAALGHASAESTFVTALFSDPCIGARAAAARGLYRTGSANASRHLVKALDDDAPAVRRQALLCLGWSRSSEAFPSSLVHLHDSSKDVRRAAIKAIDMVGATSAVPALTEALADKDIGVRQEANGALERLTSHSVGFHAEGAEEERLQAVEAWRQWWAENE